ncbi:MAG: hypothetical protein HS116_26385 [Planctomycetes bacterium]|nr:hypothetical protein [Planctomycetota bacterium]
MSEEAPPPASDPGSNTSTRRLGPRFGPEALETLTQREGTALAAPTWRGWVIGLLSVAVLCKIVPVTDYVLNGTRLTLNVLPFTSIFAVFALVAVYNLGLWLLRKPLGLTRQDIVLVLCMTMVANHLPGHGFMSYFAAETAGVFQFAGTENDWQTNLWPKIDEGLTPRDPVDPNSTAVRPVESFWTGLKADTPVPYGSWAGPYARWALAMMLMYGLMLAICGLLRRQWSEREKLPFPLAQVPDEILDGLDRRTGGAPPYWSDRLAWWGFGIAFLMQSWNALPDYFPMWPELPLKNLDFGWKYLTEPPLNHLNPVWFVIYPSVIALTFLVSSEISFSLWFFYWVLKAAVLVAILGFTLGDTHSYFMWSPYGHKAMFINQGVGALIGMVLAGLWLARGPLKLSLWQALGLEPGGGEAGEEGISPRTLWSLLAICFLGLVGWLVWANIGLLYAIFAVLCLVILVTGVARLVSEGGVFYPQVMCSPIELTTLLAPPATMGAATLVPLTMWSRLAVFDYYRLAPTVPLMTALQIGSLQGVKRRPLYLGIGAAAALSLVLGFFGFFQTVYRAEGGASQGGWVLNDYPVGEYRKLSNSVTAIESYEKRMSEYAAQGKEMPRGEVPQVALRDTKALMWIVVGMVILFGIVVLRSRIFWFPHPIGYVVWAGQRAIGLMWFSFFLGWLIKAAIVKYGGLAVYRRWKRFFVGMIVGEAVCALLWITIAWFRDFRGGYTMHFN